MNAMSVSLPPTIVRAANHLRGAISLDDTTRKVPQYNVIDDPDPTTAPSSATFMLQASIHGICLFGCESHVMTTGDPILMEVTRLWTYYCRTMAGGAGWTVSPEQRAFTRNFLLHETVLHRAFETCPCLKTGSSCGDARFNTNKLMREEYCLITMAPPFNVKESSITECFLSVKVKDDKSKTAIVPRSAITALSFVVAHKAVTCGVQGTGIAVGLSVQLAQIVTKNGAEYKNMMTNSGVDIIFDSPSDGSKKRKWAEESQSAGVLHGMTLHKILLNSLGLQNPWTIRNHSTVGMLPNHLLSQVTGTLADDDSDDDDNSDDDDSDVDSQKDDGTPASSALRMQKLINHIKKKGLFPYAMFKGLIGNDDGTQTADATLMPLKTTNGNVRSKVSHYMLTVHVVSRQPLAPRARPTRGTPGTPTSPTSTCWQFIVVANDTCAELCTESMSGVLEPVHADVYRMRDDVLVWLMPPAKPVVSKLTHMNMRATTYNDSAAGEIKTSAWKDYWTDFRVAFMINCSDDIDTMRGSSVMLARYFDLMNKFYSTADAKHKLMQLARQLGFKKYLLIMQVLDQAHGMIDVHLKNFKSAVQDANTKHTEPTARLKKLLNRWYGEQMQIEDPLEDLRQLAQACGATRKGGSSIGIFDDSHRSVMHHNPQLPELLVQIAKSEAEQAAGKAAAAAAFTSQIVVREMRCFFNKLGGQNAATGSLLDDDVHVNQSGDDASPAPSSSAGAGPRAQIQVQQATVSDNGGVDQEEFMNDTAGQGKAGSEDDSSDAGRSGDDNGDQSEGEEAAGEKPAGEEAGTD
jgi:hypothetical protein